MLEIHDTKGRLTSYGLSCGFIERKKVANVSVTMWREHGVYHVRSHDHKNSQRLFWRSFGTLSDARKCYNRARPATLESIDG